MLITARCNRPTCCAFAHRWLRERREQIAAEVRSRPQNPPKETKQLQRQVAALDAFFGLLYRSDGPGDDGPTVLELLAFASFRCAAGTGLQSKGCCPAAA
jgi:hypothetical protein